VTLNGFEGEVAPERKRHLPEAEPALIMYLEDAPGARALGAAMWGERLRAQCALGGRRRPRFNLLT
jgi:hypothetical protein